MTATAQTAVRAASATVTTPATPTAKEQARQRFVLDVVHSAVGLPQPDPQDRLRVLYAAADVVAPINDNLAQQFAKEGTAIETKLVAEGQKPAVSMLAGGHVDCASAVTYVQALPPTAVVAAEQSLLAAITSCPHQVSEAAKRKLEAGSEQGVVAARAIMALMETAGFQSEWSQAMFVKMFSSLPADAASAKDEAPNYAAMFDRAAGDMSKDVVKTAGLTLLVWLAKVPQSPERSVAANLVSAALSDKLNAAGLEELLRSDVVAQQVVSTAQQGAVLSPPQDDNVSVLRAMSDSGDRTQGLNSMPAPQRAREAAASGFASGTSGNRQMADHYFDIAFASVDQVWDDRAASKADAPEIVQEVSEAAAQVDPVAALQRAQRLQDPSAEAISMLAVARVVVGQQ